MPIDYIPRTVENYPKFALNSGEKVKANQKSWTNNIPKWMYLLIENNIQTSTVTPKIWLESTFKSIRNKHQQSDPHPWCRDKNCIWRYYGVL